MNQRKLMIVVEDGNSFERLSNDLADFKEVKIVDAMSIEQTLNKLLFHDNKLAIQTITGLMLVKSEEIILFQYLNESRCWQVLLTDRKTYKLRVNTTAKNILDIHTSLAQINQDHVVNLNYLQFIENTTNICVFRTPYSDITQIVSQRYLRKLKDKLSLR